MIRHSILRRAQIQSVETIAVVIIIIILIIIGIAFWGNVKKSDVQQTAAESQDLSVVEISKYLNEMPEFNCYQSGVEDVNCVDLYKILAFNATMNNRSDPAAQARADKFFAFYRPYFKNSRIVFEQIYPAQSAFNITIYDNNISNTTTRQIYLPVIIKDSITGRNNFGVVIVDGYYRP